MDIAFRARNIEVPDLLKGRTFDRVTRLGRASAMERADVLFLEERNPRIIERAVCEITLHGAGRMLRAQAAATDPVVAADRVLEKLRHRSERLRGRLMQSGGPPRPGLGGRPRQASLGVGHGSVHFGAHRHGAARDPDVVADAVGACADRGPNGEITIVETTAAVGVMTPEDAALEMARLNHDLYFFVNTETAEGAVVYRRLDGNVGLMASAGVWRAATRCAPFGPNSGV